MDQIERSALQAIAYITQMVEDIRKNANALQHEIQRLAEDQESPNQIDLYKDLLEAIQRPVPGGPASRFQIDEICKIQSPKNGLRLVGSSRYCWDTSMRCPVRVTAITDGIEIEYFLLLEDGRFESQYQFWEN